MSDAVERQLAAYNDHDIDAFAACYAEDVVIEDGRGEIQVHGREQLRTRYARYFSRAPAVRAEIRSRIRVGPYVVDDEWITGHPAGDLHAVAIYRVGPESLIEHVRLLT